ncbi:MAG: acyltransferase family protein [Betaproteobacteria bacterium]
MNSRTGPPATEAPAEADTRLAFLDALRVLALGLLIAYHVGMYYVTWDWHLKSPFSSTTLEPWMRLVNPWRMSLLFVISGAVTAMLLRRRTRGWLAPRLGRLGLPLAAGVLVIVPPQSYWQVVEQMGYAGSYPEFLTLYLSGHQGFCAPAGSCLIVPTWNHLWFLPYLMVYTVVLWASVRAKPHWLDRAGLKLSSRLSLLSLLVVPWLVLAVGQIALRPWFDVTHALVDDSLAHAQYLPAFLAGALLARTPGAWPAIARFRLPALLLMLGVWTLLLSAREVPVWLLSTAYSAQQWAGVITTLGFAWVHLNRSGPWLQELANRVFAVYVLHQTLIILLAVALRPLALQPVAEGPLLVVGTVFSALALVRVSETVKPLRPWLGLPRT